ncbi:hypothetical protein OCH239_22110 [Roseivivax halodurans JCM 10272]|uniref:Porin n=1 Tax=Roseivivax halodurans JCM 10272 TaxID=1449350 RepID=X7EFQ1_9RHOB|nr:hypothetical protein [Roseivivax halodurans]ETX14720.1 hypothetical protein OCH239_22110 [Roseivivax halodurans JCM 10272]
MKTITLVQAGALVALTILGAYAASGGTPQVEPQPQCSAETCVRPVGEV